MKFTSELFDNEGSDNLDRTVRIVAEAVALHNVDTVVTFTAIGEGALKLRALLPQPELHVIAVTFPAESFAISGENKISIGIPDAKTRELLLAKNVAIVQAAMPFRGYDVKSMSSTARVIRQSLAIFGGGMNLCVQAIIMACDAGYLKTSQRCIAFSGDTAIVARAAHTHTFLSEQSRFAVELVLCKALEYQITRSRERVDVIKRVTPSPTQLRPDDSLALGGAQDLDESNNPQPNES